MGIVFFEDTSWKNFVPLSYTRSLFDIKIGSLTTFEHFNMKSAKFLTRQYLEKVTNQRHTNCNVNKFKYKILMGRLKKSSFEYLYESIVHDKEISSNKLSTEIIEINKLDNCGTLYSWPWDFIFQLRDVLYHPLRIKNKVASGVKVIGKNPVCVDKTSKIDEGTILDVTDGGIYVGPESVIHQSS